MSDTTQPTEDLSQGLRVTPGVDFPLPPERLREQLMNDNAAAEAKAGPAPAAKPERSRPVAVLAFVEGIPQTTISLKYPFRLDGVIVDTITVRALTAAETGEVVTRVGPANLDAYDFYASMTGLPAEVVRALPGVDGEAITDAAFDFLPRFMRAPVPG